MQWSLEIKKMSWVENTVSEVDFIIQALKLKGNENVLDIACGYGRHSLELARRGFKVTGVDSCKLFIDDAKENASKEKLSAEFICSDLRELTFNGHFDVVLNMADGAIGYFETDEENLKTFDLIANSLKPGGKHLMGICSADHAKKHFPKRHWEAGSQSLSLADFLWNEKDSRMLYRGHVFEFGSTLPTFPDKFPSSGDRGIRLYTFEELKSILNSRNIEITASYSAYDCTMPRSDKSLMQIICSNKKRTVIT